MPNRKDLAKVTASQLAIDTLVRNGARWANNILTELLGNYGMSLSEKRRELLETAVHALADFAGPD